MLEQIRLLLKIIFLTRKQLVLQLCKENIGRDASPSDLAPDELGCAESVTEILRQAGVFPKVITGTWTLMDALFNSKQWVPVQIPKPGDVIISATGTSKHGREAPFVGHVGIVGEKDIIYSNNSYNGLWMTVYDIDSWKARYAAQGGYPVYYFRYVGVV